MLIAAACVARCGLLLRLAYADFEWVRVGLGLENCFDPDTNVDFERHTLVL